MVFSGRTYGTRLTMSEPVVNRDTSPAPKAFNMCSKFFRGTMMRKQGPGSALRLLESRHGFVSAGNSRALTRRDAR